MSLRSCSGWEAVTSQVGPHPAPEDPVPTAGVHSASRAEDVPENPCLFSLPFLEPADTSLSLLPFHEFSYRIRIWLRYITVTGPECWG